MSEWFSVTNSTVSDYNQGFKTEGYFIVKIQCPKRILGLSSRIIMNKVGTIKWLLPRLSSPPLSPLRPAFLSSQPFLCHRRDAKREMVAA